MGPAPRYSVLIVGPNDIFRSGCRALFGADHRFTVLADVASADRLTPEQAGTHPDVIVLDVGADTSGGLAQLRTLRSVHPQAAMILLTDDLDTDSLVAATHAGTRAFLVKGRLSGALLLRAAEMLASSEASIVDDGLLPLMLHEAPRQPATRPSSMVPLTQRELEVLRLLAGGLSDQEIARTLGIARTTIHSHISSLFRKMPATNRVQLGIVAVQYRLLTDDAGEVSPGRSLTSER